MTVHAKLQGVFINDPGRLNVQNGCFYFLRDVVLIEEASQMLLQLGSMNG